jgi:hypothetical protein
LFDLFLFKARVAKPTGPTSASDGASSSARDRALEAAKAIWKAKQQDDATNKPLAAAAAAAPEEIKAPTARANKPKKRPIDDVSSVKPPVIEEKVTSSNTAVAAPSNAMLDADGAAVDTAFVAGLPFHAEAEDIANMFSRIGPIDSVRVVAERCFAFVRFSAPDAETARAFVDIAIEQLNNEPYVHGTNKIRVSRARPAKRDANTAGNNSHAGNSHHNDWVDHDARDGKDVYSVDSNRGYLASTVAATGGGGGGGGGGDEADDDANKIAKRATIDWGFDD